MQQRKKHLLLWYWWRYCETFAKGVALFTYLQETAQLCWTSQRYWVCTCLCAVCFCKPPCSPRAFITAHILTNVLQVLQVWIYVSKIWLFLSVFVSMYVCVCSMLIFIPYSSVASGHREYYTSTRWRRFILQWVVSKTYVTRESELDSFGNHEL